MVRRRGDVSVTRERDRGDTSDVSRWEGLTRWKRQGRFNLPRRMGSQTPWNFGLEPTCGALVPAQGKVWDPPGDWAIQTSPY